MLHTNIRSVDLFCSLECLGLAGKIEAIMQQARSTLDTDPAATRLWRRGLVLEILQGKVPAPAYTGRDLCPHFVL